MKSNREKDLWRTNYWLETRLDALILYAVPFRRIKQTLLIVAFLAADGVIAANTIYWQTYHLPPILIKTGNQVGQGFVDQTLQLITERLPQYEHKQPLSSHARALENMRLGKPVCHPSLFKTDEREQFARFSIPSMISPNHRFVLSSQNSAGISGQAIDLVEFMMASEFMLGLVKGRSYGQSLDSVIAQIPAEKLMHLSAEEADVNLKLVSLGRLGATIAYPYEVQYFNQHSEDVNALIGYQIQGNEPYSLGYIACPNNAWGNQVIDDIDAILRSLRTQPEYIEAMTRWWQSERTNPQFLDRLESVFATEGVSYAKDRAH